MGKLYSVAHMVKKSDQPPKVGTKSSKGHRAVSVKIKTARGRTNSSQRWLQRQLNDPYVQRAQALGYRSRAAFKLIELNEKYKFLKPGMTVIDLGAAPGGWTQVLVDMLSVEKAYNSKVIALDILEMESILGATCLQADFTEDEALDQLEPHTKSGVNIVLSDMAPVTMGHKQTDHLRIMHLVELAYDFAIKVLKPDGVFVAKALQGGTEGELLANMKKKFHKVMHFKPPSSRKESSEMYVIAIGFKGNPTP